MFAVLFVLALAQEAGADKPAALLKFERARAELRSGRVQCVVSGGAGIVGMPVVQYTMEMAKNGDVVVSFDGDLEGVLGRDGQGYPMQVGRELTLLKGDVAFQKLTSEPKVAVAPRDAWGERRMPPVLGGFVDLRTIGMAPTWGQLVGRPIEAVISTVVGPCIGYTVQREGNIHRVTARRHDGGQVTYEIDEAQGWNATRISGRSAAGDTWECVSELRETGGVWFPQLVRLTVNGEQRTEWLVTEASFNRPGDHAGWEPADIGFEAGMTVSVFGTRASGKGLRWDGQKACPYEEFEARLKAGEIKVGPTVARIRAATWIPPGQDLLTRLRTSPRVLESFVSTWELYVAQFCAQYTLNADQREQAYKVLDRARENANQYLSHKGEALRTLEKKRDSGEWRPGQVAEAFAELRRPVDEIFESQLKPALEKLPTRDQRHAAQARDGLDGQRRQPEH